MKAQRKGFTLVEMLVATAVMAIVLGEVAAILASATKVTSNGAYEVSVQSEASQVVQMIEELMVDANDSITKTAGAGGSDKITIKNVTGEGAAAVYTTYVIELVKDKPGKNYGTLYISKNGGAKKPMAEYVKQINLQTGTYAVNSTVTLDLQMEGENGYKYNVEKDIYNRNEIGTGGSKPPKTLTSSGSKSLNVLRYHEYDIKDSLPHGKNWSKPQWENSTVAAQAATYYSLDADNYKIKATDYLEGTDDACGSFTLVFKEVDNEENEFKLSVYSDKVGLPGADYNIIYQYTTNATNYYSFIPILGVSLEDAVTSHLELYVGQKKLDEVDLTKPEDGSITGALTPTNRWMPTGTNTFWMQFDDPIQYNVDVPSNSLKYAVGRMNESCTSQYCSFVTSYECILWVKTEVKFSDDRTISVNTYIYPVSDSGRVFNDAQDAKFWALVNSGGGSNDTINNLDVEVGGGDGGGGGGGYTDDFSSFPYADSASGDGKFHIKNAAWEGHLQFETQGTVNVTFDRDVTNIITWGGSATGSGRSYTFTDFNGQIDF